MLNEDHEQLVKDYFFRAAKRYAEEDVELSDFFKWQANSVKQVSIRPPPERIQVHLTDFVPAQNQCYDNSMKVSNLMHDAGLGVNYVEGLLVVAGVVVRHAWSALGDTHFDELEKLLKTVPELNCFERSYYQICSLTYQQAIELKHAATSCGIQVPHMPALYYFVQMKGKSPKASDRDWPEIESH